MLGGLCGGRGLLLRLSPISSSLPFRKNLSCFFSSSSCEYFPTNINLFKKEKKLQIEWSDSQTMDYSAEYLRVYSPSAENKRPGALFQDQDKKVAFGKKFVEIIGVELVGNYAIRITFDDFHDTGIYSWDTLRSLGQNKPKLMRDYIKAIKSQNLSRIPKKLLKREKEKLF